MDPRHRESFLQSLNATTVPQLVEVARLWEDELLVTYRCPFFLVRVGDVQASFNSSATALSLYKEAQALIEPDDVFNGFVTIFEENSRADAEDQRCKWSQGVFNQTWKPTNRILFPTIPKPPDWSPGLQQGWGNLPRDSTLQYYRYFCIENNIMENTFLLSSRSLIHLARNGYDESAVVFLSNSAIQDRALIAKILQDTHQVRLLRDRPNITDPFSLSCRL
jgi:hypothetical protein